jgi:hypothetical protein
MFRDGEFMSLATSDSSSSSVIADGIVSVDYLKNFPQIIQVFDVYGAIVLENFSDGTIDLSALNKGFYTLYLNGHFKPILKN